MQPLAVPTNQLAGDVAVAWWRARRPDDDRPRQDPHNVLTRLDVAVDRLEGAYQQLDDLAPLLEAYAASLRRREGQ